MGRRYPVRGKAFLPLEKLKFILSYHFNTPNQNYYSLAKQTGSDWLRYTNALLDKHLIVQFKRFAQGALREKIMISTLYMPFSAFREE